MIGVLSKAPLLTATGLGRGFNIGIDSNVVLDGLTITRGYYPSSGGAIYYNMGNYTPLIRNCDISDNNCTSTGGGIYSSSGNITIIGCKIHGNHAGTNGGGIYCSGLSTTTIKIIDCNITGNMSSSSGGGIYATSPIKIGRSLIAGNIASGPTTANGGGICGSSSIMDINNSIVAGNYAKTNGGGIYKSSSGVLASNCTFAGNSAGGLGGGVYSTVSAVHSIFWDNNDSTGVTTSAQIYPLPASPAPFLLFCCIQDPENKFGGAAYGNIDVDPMFVKRAE